MEKQNFLAKKRTRHPSAVCGPSTQYSLHTCNVVAGELPQGVLFHIKKKKINIPLSCRPGCLIHRNKLGIAFDTGVENTPREFTETQEAPFPNRKQAGAHK